MDQGTTLPEDPQTTRPGEQQKRPIKEYLFLDSLFIFILILFLIFFDALFIFLIPMPPGTACSLCHDELEEHHVHSLEPLLHELRSMVLGRQVR